LQIVAITHLLASGLCLSLAVLPAAADAETVSGKVVGVTDGDTLIVLVDHTTVRVRLASIDAPEKGQPFGQASKQGLSQCAFGSQVNVEWHKRDRYGRTVGKVMAGTIDCGLRQVELGLAWHYRAHAKEQVPADRVVYAQAEEAARQARSGLWSEAAPFAPWEYRHQRRATVEAQ